MRLINRHADNHSGFMVTTDYQVVQGDIFHIRDVTLFQWENTCSARYKLHERAYTRRHVCCIVSALVGTRKRELCIYTCMCDLRARTLAHQEDWLSGRRPGAPFFSSFIFVQPFSLPLLSSQNHSHVRRLQKYPATFPRERSSDRSPAT